jgi:RNA polymerase sigma-70 factor (ECF subfamily)
VADEPIAAADAFDVLFAAEFAAIARAVFLVTGDLAVAEEIAQEAFARAWSRWHRVSKLDRPGAWVRVVAVRMALRSLRRDRKRALLTRGLRTTTVAEASDAVTVDVVAALAKLSPSQRMAVVLSIVCDLSDNEIAHHLGCRPATARVHLHRGRLRLLEQLGTEYQHDR